MGVKITLEGKRNLEKKLEQLQVEMKKLREEKNLAYSATGDTWHDNPYFKKLELDEEALNVEIKETSRLLENAEIIEKSEHKTEMVEIGSIVKCRCVYSAEEEEVEIFEIVGHGESEASRGKIHYDTIVGKNLLGHHINDKFSFMTPGGSVEYTVLKFYENWEEARADN